MKYLNPSFLFVAIWLLASCTSHQEAQQSSAADRWPVVRSDNDVGLKPVNCWFGRLDGTPPIECFEMQVREDHESPKSRMISYPVLRIRSEVARHAKSPLLHLGAGGPGAPMNLDDPASVRDLVQIFRRSALQQGRDLIVIDPRGAGLSRPLLTCNTYVTNERNRLHQSLTLTQALIASTNDYRDCVERFLGDDINLNKYNSFAVANDVEVLRRTAGIERWVLYGVSYGTNYAMTIAESYPDTVESMVLDSSFVSRIGLHENYIEQTTRPYRMLFDYCSYDPDCQRPIDNVEARFWAIYRNLNEHPIWVELLEINGEASLPVLLDGERFLASVIEGIYDIQIFSDLPTIVRELESEEVETLGWYLWLHVDFQLDTSWGDVSGMAHYCYEEKPQIDFSKIRGQIDQLPPGYLRETAPIFLDWPDLCEQMQIRNTAPHLIPSKSSSVPVLFLQGNFDSVTPVSNVRKILHFFEHGQLLTFDLGHGILGRSNHAIRAMEKFLQEPHSTL